MRFASLPALAVMGLVLIGIIAAELSGFPDPQTPVQVPNAVTGPALRGAATATTSQAQPVTVLLERPPFSPERRPDPGQGSAADPSLPHLTGILISGDDRRAIFTAPETGRAEGRSTVVREGQSVGVYRVQAISPAAVMLTGPGGLHSIQPHFSTAPPPATALPGLPVPPPPPFALQGPGPAGAPLGLATYRNAPAAAAPPVPPGLGTTQ